MAFPRDIGVFLLMFLGDPAHVRCLLYGQEHVDWTAVLKRVTSHPLDVKDEAPGHKTILHMVITLSPPIHVLQAVIDAYPAALQMTEPFRGVHTNRTRMRAVDPLGLACHCGASEQVVRTILKAKLEYASTTVARQDELITVVRSCPFTVGKQESRRAIPKTLFGGTGLSHISFPLDIMKVLLDECPDGALTFVRGHTDTNEYKSLVAITIVGKNASSCPDYWTKVNLVLMAATHGTINEGDLANGRRFLVLHSFLEMISGVAMFEDQFPLYHSDIGARVMVLLDLMRQRVPEQFQCRDDFGSLPLHIAVRNRHASIHHHNRTTDDTSRLVIERLLEEHPESAGIPDARGRLPLHVAVENGLPNPCIDLLIEAEPRALTTRCLMTGMYPFQLASYGLANQMDKEDSSLDEQVVIATVETTCRLLRMAPTTAHVLATPKEPWMDNNPIYAEVQSNRNRILLYKLRIAELEARNSTLEKRLERSTDLRR